jgi:hypothetical protein
MRNGPRENRLMSIPVNSDLASFLEEQRKSFQKESGHVGTVKKISRIARSHKFASQGWTQYGNPPQRVYQIVLRRLTKNQQRQKASLFRRLRREAHKTLFHPAS